MKILASCLKALFFVLPALGNWTQEYGDSGSTSYVSFKQGIHPVETGWSYKGPGIQSVFYYADPAVSEDGVMYIPYFYAPYASESHSYFPWAELQVRAVAPNGSLLWVSEDMANDRGCASIRLTNALYSQGSNLVIVGWNCIAAFPYYTRHSQLLAFNASDGNTTWRTQILPVNDMSRIAMSLVSNAVFASGGFDCGRDQYITTISSVAKSKYVGKIYSVSLSNGSVLWELDANKTGCETQMKIGPTGERDGSELLLTPVHLKNGKYAGGDLLATKINTNNTQWIAQLRMTWNARFAFSQPKNVIFGTYGFAGNPDLIFATNVSSGNLTFSNRGFCVDGAFPSGPAVDRHGDAYYSCGNQVFKVDASGNLVWKSSVFNNTAGYPFDEYMKIPPSIHYEKDLVFFFHYNCSIVYVLSVKDGAVQHSYAVPPSSFYIYCYHAPVILGSSILYVIKVDASRFDHVLYSLAINV